MPLHIALIGSKFMGRAHGNGWAQAPRFFDLPQEIVLHAVCARDAAAVRRFAKRWGWRHAVTDFRSLLDDGVTDLVDIATPNDVHAEQAIAALEAGLHVACEKPLAATLDDARAMRDAARRAARRGTRTFVWFNYRRCPALAFAHRLVREGRLGRIYHVRATYLQDWGGPKTPMAWRFEKDRAGSGAHGDLNAHSIDLARFLTGDEIVEVSGAIAKTFIEQRPLPGRGAGRRRGRSTVDDALLFLARFRGGAIASFEASRVATGNQNRNAIEINGEQGSIRFDFERMNELELWDERVAAARRGWSRIMCTNPGDHPYASAYWPPAHPLGYEHTFVSQAADIVRALSDRDPVIALPDFEDAWKTHIVLDTALTAARERRAVKVDS